jgi:hypothetical protein
LRILEWRRTIGFGIGAGVGALAAVALSDCSQCPADETYLLPMVVLGALGAGIGAWAGGRRIPSVWPGGDSPLAVSPVVTPSVQGAVVSIDFSKAARRREMR